MQLRRLDPMANAGPHQRLLRNPVKSVSLSEAQYDRVKAAVTRAILDGGGQLSHHHGIGSEHAPYFREAIGEENWRLLRELKRAMDPRGIMNPGKLFPVSA